MFSAIALAFLIHGRSFVESTPSGALWEETMEVQRVPGYHPMIRFSSWDITRFNRSTTYMFVTPDFIQQGQFQERNGHYFFRAVMANELENSDKDKLFSEIDAGTANKLNEAYAKSMSNFEGDYDEYSKTLYITYPVKGMLQRFSLHDTMEGDDQRGSLGIDRSVVGLWHEPEPYPDKLDARTRGKVDDRGLVPFFKEAGASEGAQFNVIDLRADRTLRIHGKGGMWGRNGSTLTLTFDKGSMSLEISADGRKLLSRGKAVYVRP